MITVLLCTAVSALIVVALYYRSIACHDALTGLHNERVFSAALRRAAQCKVQHWLLSIDVNNFKAVNDTHGHAVGDSCLRRIATVLQNITRRGDTLARLHGDEFALILRGCSQAQALAVATRLVQSMGKADINSLAPDCEVGLSIGICGVERGLACIKHADDAMYTAKAGCKTTSQHSAYALSRSM